MKIISSNTLNINKFNKILYNITHCTRASANPSIFSLSRLVVGSSNAITPQSIQNASASASLITSEANTWNIKELFKSEKQNL